MASALLSRVSAVRALFVTRSYATHAVSLMNIKDRAHKFILENPYLSAAGPGDLSSPNVKQPTRIQQELLFQLNCEDLGVKPRRVRHIRPSSKDNPMLVGSVRERKAELCLCHPGVHYMRCIMLYRDLPTRCNCGHWFKLVDMERFEREREKHWQKVKDEPENIKLQNEFDEVEKELAVMIQQGNGLNNRTPGLTDFLERMSNLWERYKVLYREIRLRMDVP